MLRRTRPIAGLPVNGDPEYWLPVPGGFITHWSAPTLVRDTGGALAVAWSAPGSDWWGEVVVTRGSIIAAQSRDHAAIVRLSLADGRQEWRTPLVPWSQSVELEADDRRVYANYTEYDPAAPTPTIRIALRIQAYDLATGALAWSVDFPKERPISVAARHDTAIVAVGSELQFIDGPTGTIRHRAELDPRSNYHPTLHIAGESLYAGLDTSVTAYDLRTGARRWRTPADLSSVPRVATAPGIVLAQTRSGVAGLDAQTGRLLWDLGLGVKGYRLRATERAIVLAGGRGGGGFGLPVNLPIERATFRGRVREVKCGTVADVRIRVGSATVPVAADGTYRATVEARHAVLVEGPGAFILVKYGAPPEQRAAYVIRLTGAGEYDVPDLTLSLCT